MKRNTINTALFFVGTTFTSYSYGDMCGEASVGFGDDYIAARDNGYYTEILYDGNIVPLDLKIGCNDFKIETSAVFGADNLDGGGKPFSIYGSLDYTFYRYNSDNIDWSLSTGISAETHDASDNYQVSISGIEGTLLSLGLTLKGEIEGLPNTYFRTGVGYTESMSDSSDSSPFAMVGLGLEVPIGKFRIHGAFDAVYTDVLVGEYLKVEFGFDYLWKKNMIISGPGKTYIIPRNGKNTDSSDVIGIKYLF
ncbi:hypothetical protein KC851_02715 [Candidatus Kaiserbacteria bacterium]|nr:hypothetical protein [Candidatus Kaiserbacteria bacterium]